MSAWEWVTAAAAIWGVTSVLVAVCWALARRGGWRGATEVPPQPWHRDQLGIVRQDGDL